MRFPLIFPNSNRFVRTNGLQFAFAEMFGAGYYFLKYTMAKSMWTPLLITKFSYFNFTINTGIRTNCTQRMPPLQKKFVCFCLFVCGNGGSFICGGKLTDPIWIEISDKFVLWGHFVGPYKEIFKSFY